MRAWILYLLLLPTLATAEGRVALFDFDQRTATAPGITPYLEQALRKADPSLTVLSVSAQGNRQRGIELLDQLEQEHWDLVITITSDALQLALHRLSKTPFVFTNVHNPKAFGLDDSADRNRNFTGASYYVPVRQQLELFLALQPSIQRLGFLFDPDNRSMLAEAQEVRTACDELGIEFLYRRVASGQSLGRMAAELVIAGADALVLTSSDKIYLGVAEIEQGLEQQAVPIYSFNARGVELGAVAALASDYQAMVDLLVIPRAMALLRGEKTPAELPIGYLEAPRRLINAEALTRFGLKPPPSASP
ncbi:MAG TPA: ABC transporter substrate binding protein [Motiliproteus sp.]